MKSDSDNKFFNGDEFLTNVFKNDLINRFGHNFKNSSYLRFCFLVYYFNIDIITAYENNYPHSYSPEKEEYKFSLGLHKTKKEFFHDLPRSIKNKNSKFNDFLTTFMSCLKKLDDAKPDKDILDEIKNRLNSSDDYEVIDSYNSITNHKKTTKSPKDILLNLILNKYLIFIRKKD